MIKNFKDLWQAHTEWCQGILIREIKSLKSSDIYIGNVPDAWFNFALPKVGKPADLDLKEIKKALSPINPATTIYLWEKHRKAGFPNFLKENEYQSFGTDTWMVLELGGLKKFKVDFPVEHIGLSKFPDYVKVTNKVFKEEGGYDDRPYNEICRQVLAGKRESKTPSLSAEFFMVYKQSLKTCLKADGFKSLTESKEVYKGGKPVSGAGLFLTKEAGYFHNTATFKPYRKKGYHTALMQERINFCLKRKIPLLYSIVEYKKASFRNLERFGFKTWQVCELFTLKS